MSIIGVMSQNQMEILDGVRKLLNSAAKIADLLPEGHPLNHDFENIDVALTTLYSRVYNAAETYKMPLG